MKCHLHQLTIHYDCFGDGQPLIILPGWTASSVTMAHIFEPLFADAGRWQRIYIDPPGHGATPGLDSIQSLDGFLDILLDFVDEVVGDQPFALMGLSLGGYLARGVLLRRFEQVSGLFLAAPAIITEDDRRNLPEPTVVVHDPEALNSLIAEEAEFMALFTVQNAATVKEIQSFGAVMGQAPGDPDFLDRIRNDRDAYRFRFDVDAALPQFDKPSLIITGRQDFVVGYKDAWALLDKFPRATFVVFDRAGHMLEQKSAEMRPLITEWLARITENTNHHE